MKNKKVWMGAIGVFLGFVALEALGNFVVLKSTMDSIKNLMRPEAELNAKMWILFVTYAFFAYFFSWIFSKGYEGKGMMEGIRFGLAIGLMFQLSFSYSLYVYMPFPYSFALSTFLYGMVEMVVLGIIVAWIFGMKPSVQAAA